MAICLASSISSSAAYLQRSEFASGSHDLVTSALKRRWLSKQSITAAANSENRLYILVGEAAR
jgi:hypothetical protein